MPIESAPTLPDASASIPAAASGTLAPAGRLSLGEVAPSQVVEPLLRSARSGLVALQLRSRAVEQEASAAETARLAAVDPDGPPVAAAIAERRTQLEAELERARRKGDDLVAAARRDAAQVLADARADADALLADARADLDRALDDLNAVRGQASRHVTADPLAPAGAVAESSAEAPPPVAPEPAEPPDAAPRPEYPPPAAGPTLPPPSPAPSIPPPIVAAPVSAPVSYTTVLIQAPDGSLQQALVMSPYPVAVGQGSPMVPAPMPFAQHVVPTSGPSSGPRPSAARRLLHLDVILPLLAVLIVLVVLLAWLG